MKRYILIIVIAVLVAAVLLAAVASVTEAKRGGSCAGHRCTPPVQPRPIATAMPDEPYCAGGYCPTKAP